LQNGLRLQPPFVGRLHHRAAAAAIVVLPKFEPADEWFD